MPILPEIAQKALANCNERIAENWMYQEELLSKRNEMDAQTYEDYMYLLKQANDELTLAVEILTKAMERLGMPTGSINLFN